MPPSSTAIDPRALAKQPQREAGFQRYKSVLDGADALLREVGLAGFSIPALAERLGYTRRSIYKFFPSPYAILNELTQIYLDRLQVHLQTTAESLPDDLAWQALIHEMDRAAAEFHNAHSVSRLLILGGAVTDESFRVTEYSIRKLGQLLTRLLARYDVKLPTEPDVASLAVDIGTAVFRVSTLYHGRITDAYVAESSHAMVAYLDRHID